MGITFFEKQNFLLKLLWVFLGIICSAFADIHAILLIFLTTFIYLLFAPKLILFWLRGFLKISPFFISIFLFGIFFNISFISQLVLVGKILLILLFSVYFTATTKVEDFLSDIIFLPQNNFMRNLRIFLISTFRFVPLFLEQYKIASANYENYFQIAKIALQNSFWKIHEVEIYTLQKLENIKIREFQIFPNLVLVFILILYGIIICNFDLF